MADITDIDASDVCRRPGLLWRKSSLSGSSGACVEVAMLAEDVLVRDSKDRRGPVLRFSVGSWRAFVEAVAGGEFGR